MFKITAAVDALEIDWASLLKDDRPKPTKGSALQRFKPGKLFAKLGLSKQYAGEELYNEVLSICQREEEADSGIEGLCCIVKIFNIWSDRLEQTVQSQIRLLLKGAV